jgi:predicted glutamine amidotransferase
MCRFLLLNSKTSIDPKEFLEKFAVMAEKSRAPDGDIQGDGWGIAWLDKSGNWQNYRSLLPVWKDKSSFQNIGKTSAFLVHARSASFTHQKGILEYNQPYIYDKYAFVFNGLLKGVSLPDIPGRIGAEKIWFLLRKELNKKSPQESLEALKNLLIKNSREVIALNIGLATNKNIYSLSYFTQYPDYYHLWKFKNEHYQAICSENIFSNIHSKT